MPFDSAETGSFTSILEVPKSVIVRIPPFFSPAATVWFNALRSKARCSTALWLVPTLLIVTDEGKFVHALVAEFQYRSGNSGTGSDSSPSA